MPSKTTFFKSCTTKQEAKKLFRELAKIHHPDTATGSTETMVQIISEYERIIKILPSITDASQNTQEQTDEEFNIHISQEMQEILNNISHLPITVEIIGTWIWASGDTYKYKSYLTAYNFQWCPKKKMYSWHIDRYANKFKRKAKDIEDIRTTYGSYKVNSNKRQSIAM